MKFSKHWLKEFIKTDLDTEKLAEQLTMAGLEVDSIDSVAADFQGVVVGRVVEVSKHPDADKLTICKVDAGSGELLQIVCGAPNVRENLIVPVALIGALLPDNFKIKPAKLRGVESSGMLCSAKELGLPDTIDGLLELPQDAPIGAEIMEYLDLDDKVFEIELTANRGDCLSILGIAREVGAINRIPVSKLELPKFEADNSDVFSVSITAKDSCPRYCGRIIRGVNNSVVTPIWMKERLRRLGINSINFIVDVTNYVMLELGQPLHAFDLSKLDGSINVRYAKAGEKLALLDDTDLELKEGALVIADKNKSLALAGVMGGSYSGVKPETQDIFLESAFFIPKKIALQAREYKVQTDSSYRFERGVDYNLQLEALNRATALIIEIAGGKCGAVSEVTIKESLPNPKNIILRSDRVKKILGFSITDQDSQDILSALGLKCEVIKNGWSVTPLSYRFDIRIEEDLVEEIARIYGYHKIPEQKIIAELAGEEPGYERSARRRLYALMEDIGYHEAITYSFIDEKSQELFAWPEEVLPLANPITSEQTVMRTSLWPGLLKVVQYNLKRQKQWVRLFETGLCFSKKEKDLEQNFTVAGVACGDLYPQQWGIKSGEKAGYFDLKNDVEAILKLYSCGDVEYVADGIPKSLHPKRSAGIKVDGKIIGFIGELHPLVKDELGLDKQIALFEINISNITNKLKHKFHPPSKFPKIQRDISITISKEIPWSKVSEKVVDISGELLQNISLFDVYCNENIGLENHSLAIRMIFQSNNRTLVDDEVELLVNQVISALQQTFNASLRG